MYADIAIYPEDNFFTNYFEFIGFPHNTEASLVLHRWCAISIVATMLGRDFVFPHGFSEVLPNQFIQIIGVPATRKSTAIKQAKKLLKLAGYNNFSADKTSMAQFLIELHNITWGTEEEQAANDEFELENNIFGTTNPKETAETLPVAEYYIASDEFVDFIGRNNIDFISLLGTFWDINEVYSYPLKNSKPVYINKPTINIIAGNTPEMFAQAFPPDMQGQGFFSRLLLIHATPTGRRITIPSPPSKEDTDIVVAYLRDIKAKCVGNCTITNEAYEVYDKAYQSSETDLDDSRFQQYNGRRHMHLLKLSLVMAAARRSTVIHSCDVIMANTILTFAEYSMPKAMGMFGRGRHSIVTHKILELIGNSDGCSMKDIIKYVQQDLDNLGLLGDLINSLKAADKIQIHEGIFYPKKEARNLEDTYLVRPSWINAEERRY